MTIAGSGGRLAALDAAKGLAIMLVVWGHVVARDIKPAGNDWYPWVNARLYAFHMTFFFFLAGYAYFYKPHSDWMGKWRRTALRLVPAYLLFSLLVLVAKQVAVRFAPVDRPLGALADELLQQMLYPTLGFASFLWFIVVVLLVQAATPLLLGAVRGRLAVALALAAALHLLSVSGHVTDLFALKEFCRYLLFFLLGAWAVQHQASFNAMCGRWYGWALSLLAALLLLPMVWLPTIAGALSLPALFGLSQALCQRGRGGWLIFLGLNSFTIYLMNSLCLGLGRVVVLRTVGWDDWRFPPLALLLLALGLLGPIAVQRLLLSRQPYLNRITR